MSLLQALSLPPLPTQATKAANAAGPAPLAAKAAAARRDRLLKESDAWRNVHRQADERIAQLKAAILAHYAGSDPEVVAQVEKGAAKLDAILDTVDHSLADILADAAGAIDESAMQAELKNAKALLTKYIGYVKSEPLIAHMDANPFGVSTGLKALLVNGLTDAAKAIG